MLVQEREGAFAVDAMAPLEVFDFRFVGQPELGVEPADFGVFVGNERVAADQV